MSAYLPLPEHVRGFLDSGVYRNYHLGCGNVLLSNAWLNIGFWEDIPRGELFQNPFGSSDTMLLNFDLTLGIPARDNQLNSIYHSHFLEHLTYLDGIALLRDIFRKLSPGGTHRIVMPDLRKAAEAYLFDQSALLEHYRAEAIEEQRENYPTKASVFMHMLYEHSHKMYWDFETLEHWLAKIGFKNISRKSYQASQLKDIALIEINSDLRIAESMYVECEK